MQQCITNAFTKVLLNQSLGGREVQKVQKCAYVIYEWYLCKLAKDGVDAWTPPTLREGPKIYQKKREIYMYIQVNNYEIVVNFFHISHNLNMIFSKCP